MRTIAKWILSLSTILFLLGLVSCGGGDDDVTPGQQTTNEDPGAFTVTVSDITSTSAKISWTTSVDPDGDAVSYDIAVGTSVLETGVTVTSVSLTGLSEATDYVGAIIAKDGNGGSTESLFNFTTESGSSTTECTNDNSIDQNNRGCSETPGTNTYDDSTVSAGKRVVTTNGIPTHDYSNQIPNIVSSLDNSTKTYSFDNVPSKASSVTTVAGSDGHPQWRFGVATNGVALDPAPAEPFIFENTSTGEYNWDWVMEPNNNMNDVGLDCAIAHVQPDGLYHYHGDLGVYAEQLSSGITTGTAPSDPVQVGWAADGFPVFYYYGPTSDGSSVELLSSSYQLKTGNRSGDGVSEPCGEYNGKYTNDYEYVSGAGDLDECNGIDRSVTLSTGTYSYFYVITSEFPVISRCIVGTPDDSFKIGP